MRIAIADDHALLRQGLIVLMRSHHPSWTFHEAASYKDALALLARTPIDLLLIDLKMPGMAGGESLRTLRASYPDSRIAVLTGIEDRASILECLDAGVHGYILKADAADSMLGAIDTLLSGSIYVPPAITRIVGTAIRPVKAAWSNLEPSTLVSVAQPATSSHGRPSSERSANLTPRQSDVLKLLAEGRSTKDIARRLDLGLGTVKVHLAGIYRALGAGNRMEAVVRAGRLNVPE